jgi:hypothetical protein
MSLWINDEGWEMALSELSVKPLVKSILTEKYFSISILPDRLKNQTILLQTYETKPNRKATYILVLGNKIP